MAIARRAELFRTAELERRAADLGDELRRAEPFPHIVLDDMLTIGPGEAGPFPPADWSGWEPLRDAYQRNKRTCADIDRIPPPFDALITELSRPRFLRALERITGIEQLIPDPHLLGGGLHLSGPGGVLTPHTDFHRHQALNLFRRINVLVYLNDEWSESDGGCLTLYAGGRPATTVVPAWGRTVIFRTDDRSIHGFPTPVREGRWRQSVALYYYTSAEAQTFSGDDATYWREHGTQRGVVRRGRMLLYHALSNAGRSLAILAHLVNPNRDRAAGGFARLLARLRRR